MNLRGRVRDLWLLLFLWTLVPLSAAAEEPIKVLRLIYRNVRFNSFGVLDVSDSFDAEHPGYVRRVLEEYEKARKWILAHPDETAALLAAESHISLPVAKQQLSRNDFSNPVPDAAYVQSLQAAGPILTEDGLVRPGTDAGKAIDALIDARFARALPRE